MRNGIEAVGFDLDGTLYPNYRLYVRLIPFVLKEGPLLWAFGKARDILHAEAADAALQEPPPLSSDFYTRQARIMADLLGTDPVCMKEKIERLIYRKWELHFKKIRLFAHAAETLAEIKRAGLKLGLLSDFPPEAKLASLGIGDCWDAVLCTERIGALKPDRRVFERLAGSLGLAPEKILYVGNSRRYDVAGAKGAGMRTALITGLFSETSDSGESSDSRRSKKNTFSPDFVFHNYRQLLRYML